MGPGGVGRGLDSLFLARISARELASVVSQCLGSLCLLLASFPKYSVALGVMAVLVKD